METRVHKLISALTAEIDAFAGRVAWSLSIPIRARQRSVVGPESGGII